MRPDLIRAIVLDIYARVMDHGELADHALHRALRGHKELHSTERRQISTALFAMIRFRRRYDFLIDAGLGKHGIDSLPTPDAHQLRLAAALAFELGESEESALRMAGTSIRIPLRQTGVKWPGDPVARLAVEESLPTWAANRLVEEYGSRASAIAHALNARAPLTLRANTLKATREDVLAALKKEDIESRASELSPWGLILTEHHNVFGLDAYKKGLFEIQDEGSQLIALATGAKPGMRVIDACAGGGGKTLALSAMMKNKGALIACDVDDRRMRDLRPRARLAGAFNIEPQVAPDGVDDALKPMINRADVVLVDAPCSGTGSWRRHPDARWRLKPEEVASYSELQARILRRYAACVKPGGLLVYATCSILSAENEAIADAFAEESKAFKPEILAIPEAARDGAGRLRVLPHIHGTDGFFAAGFRRSTKPGLV